VLQKFKNFKNYYTKQINFIGKLSLFTLLLLLLTFSLALGLSALEVTSFFVALAVVLAAVTEVLRPPLVIVLLSRDFQEAAGLSGITAQAADPARSAHFSGTEILLFAEASPTDCGVTLHAIGVRCLCASALVFGNTRQTGLSWLC
jgi:hypothetical protein